MTAQILKLRFNKLPHLGNSSCWRFGSKPWLVWITTHVQYSTLARNNEVYSCLPIKPENIFITRNAD